MYPPAVCVRLVALLGNAEVLCRHHGNLARDAVLDRSFQLELAVHCCVSEAEEELVLADVTRLGLDLGKEALESLQ